MTLNKPQCVADLEPPFERIGDEGWEMRFRTLLADYGVPLPQPVAAVDLEAREAELGVALDASWRRFLLAVGPIDFDGFRVLPPHEIVLCQGIWFATHMQEQDSPRLSSIGAAIDYLGSGDFVGWDRDSGAYVRVSHDPAGARAWLPTFDDCIREQCVELATGFYGWPDDDVEALVEEVKRNLFPEFRSGGNR